MTTYVNVQSRIADDLQVVSMTSQITQQIKLAIKHYRTFPFFFNEAETTLSASLAYVALPTDFISEIGLYIRQSNTDLLLPRKPDNEIFEHRTSTGGRPTSYTIFQNRIEFDRSCNVVYTLPLRYIKELTELSAAGDENEWLVSGEDLIVYRAEKMLYGVVLKNKSQAELCAELERHAFNGLNRYNQSKNTSGYTRGHYL